jgi:hypothetical protein
MIISQTAKVCFIRDVSIESVIGRSEGIIPGHSTVRIHSLWQGSHSHFLGHKRMRNPILIWGCFLNGGHSLGIAALTQDVSKLGISSHWTIAQWDFRRTQKRFGENAPPLCWALKSKALHGPATTWMALKTVAHNLGWSEDAPPADEVGKRRMMLHLRTIHLGTCKVHNAKRAIACYDESSVVYVSNPAYSPDLTRATSVCSGNQKNSQKARSFDEVEQRLEGITVFSSWIKHAESVTEHNGNSYQW